MFQSEANLFSGRTVKELHASQSQGPGEEEKLCPKLFCSVLFCFNKHFVLIDQWGIVVQLLIYEAKNRNLESLCLVLSQENKGNIQEPYLSHVGKGDLLQLAFFQNTKTWGEGQGGVLTFTVFQDNQAKVEGSIVIIKDIVDRNQRCLKMSRTFKHNSVQSLTVIQ